MKRRVSSTCRYAGWNACISACEAAATAAVSSAGHCLGSWERASAGGGGTTKQARTAREAVQRCRLLCKRQVVHSATMLGIASRTQDRLVQGTEVGAGSDEYRVSFHGPTPVSQQWVRDLT